MAYNNTIVHIVSKRHLELFLTRYSLWKMNIISLECKSEYIKKICSILSLLKDPFHCHFFTRYTVMLLRIISLYVFFALYASCAQILVCTIHCNTASSSEKMRRKYCKKFAKKCLLQFTLAHVTSSSSSKQFGIAHKIRTNQYRVYPIQSIIQ